jgi:hypothetical protein
MKQLLVQLAARARSNESSAHPMRWQSLTRVSGRGAQTVAWRRRRNLAAWTEWHGSRSPAGKRQQCGDGIRGGVDHAASTDAKHQAYAQRATHRAKTTNCGAQSARRFIGPQSQTMAELILKSDETGWRGNEFDRQVTPYRPSARLYLAGVRACSQRAWRFRLRWPATWDRSIDPGLTVHEWGHIHHDRRRTGRMLNGCLNGQ